MVILIIQVEDFSFGLVDLERDSPVAGDGKAPSPLAVAVQPMGIPATLYSIVTCLTLPFQGVAAPPISQGAVKAASTEYYTKLFKVPP
jgi:hypothetical protein